MVFGGVGLFWINDFTIVFHVFLLLVEYRNFSLGLHGLYANFELAVLRQGSNSFLRWVYYWLLPPAWLSVDRGFITCRSVCTDLILTKQDCLRVFLSLDLDWNNALSSSGFWPYRWETGQSMWFCCYASYLTPMHCFWFCFCFFLSVWLIAMKIRSFKIYFLCLQRNLQRKITEVLGYE